MNEVVKCQPRNLTIITKLKCRVVTHSSSDSIAERANSAVQREFGGGLKTKLTGYEMRSDDKKSSYSLDYQMICVTSEHGKPLSRKIGNREAAIIACHTGYFIDDETFEHALKYLSELKGSPVTEENFPQAKKEFREQTKTDFHNLGGNA